MENSKIEYYCKPGGIHNDGMNRIHNNKFLTISTILISILRLSWVNANDAEFGHIITFENFDHFKVSESDILISICLILVFFILNSQASMNKTYYS